MSGTVLLVPYGEPALRALRDVLVDRHRLDPVHVVVPSALVGVTVRRALSGTGAHAGLHFGSLPQLLARLREQGGGQPPAATDSAVRRAHLARHLVLDPAWPEGARSPSGLDVLTALQDELDQAEPPAAAIITAAATGARAQQVLSLLTQGLTDTTALSHGAEVWSHPTVLHLPRRLSGLERRLCARLVERGVLTVLLGLTGADEVDASVRELAHALGPVTVASGAPRTLHVVRTVAPDPEEEVRSAVRRVLDLLRAGAAPHRLALTYRSSVPYARLLHEQLTAAGIPHHVPRQRSLAQTPGARVLLGLLRLPDQEWSRGAVFAWLACAPLHRPGGGSLRVTRYDRAARQAGITRGLASWDARLSALPQDEDTSVHPGTVAELREVVHELGQTLEQLQAATSWSAFAGACRSALTSWLRPTAHWQAPDADVRLDTDAQALDQLVGALHGLAELDGLVPYPTSLQERSQPLEQALDRGVRDGAGLGRGVLVAPLRDLAGADLDHVHVLGLVEGSFPPRPREHPLLRDEARVLLGMRTTSDQRLDERRDLAAVLASGPAAHLSAPLGDPRGQRPLHVSPWFAGGAEPAPMTSFAEAALAAPTCATGQEALVQAMTGSDLAVAVLEPVLARGLDAVDARRRGVFGPWLGGLSHPLDPDVQERLSRSPSASGLQTYATCPFRWYGDKALGLRAREEPSEDAVSALDRGSLLHTVLERVVGAHLGQSPDEPWSKTAHALAESVLDEEAEALAQAGKAGRPAVWRVQVEQARRNLRRFLLQDDAYRRARRAVPQAVEAEFGMTDDGPPPAALALQDGTVVSLRGSIDRVDVTEGGVVVVLDYKSGRETRYQDFPEDGKVANGVDLSGRGQHLQLPLYAVAARRDHGLPDSKVEGYYAFLDSGGVRRGGVVDEVQHRRLLEVVSVTTGSMSSGTFPARPGAYDGWYHRFDNCGFCAFDRVCSRNRDDQWESLRDDLRVAPYQQLAEGVADDAD